MEEIISLARELAVGELSGMGIIVGWVQTLIGAQGLPHHQRTGADGYWISPLTGCWTDVAYPGQMWSLGTSTQVTLYPQQIDGPQVSLNLSTGTYLVSKWGWVRDSLHPDSLGRVLMLSYPASWVCGVHAPNPNLPAPMSRPMLGVKRRSSYWLGEREASQGLGPQI